MPQFSHPLWIGIGVIFPLLLLGVVKWRKRRPVGIYFPGVVGLRGLSNRIRHLSFLSQLFFGLALVSLILILGGPYRKIQQEETTAEGVDIVLLLDISTSMSAKDFKPENRLEAARAVVRDFVRRRVHDRLALITFAGSPYVVCPLTTDHFTLESLLDAVTLIPFDADGTAVGVSLASAVNRLRESTARSKVVILLTDGVNNRGEISPEQAGDFCRRYNIRVYTVGVGSGRETEVIARLPDGSPTWIRTVMDFDGPMLEALAKRTGGRFFKADDSAQLKRVYGEIDILEKTRLEKRLVTVRAEAGREFLWVSLFFLTLGIVLQIAGLLWKRGKNRRPSPVPEPPPPEPSSSSPGKA